MSCCNNPSFNSETSREYCLCEQCGSEVSKESIKEWLRTTKISEKIQEFNGVMLAASSRYEIPGVLDAEDLYQEALHILDMMFVSYDFSPDSDDFRKMFKTHLWHELSTLCQRENYQKRDWKSKISEQTSLEDGVGSLWDVIPGDTLPADIYIEYKESASRVEAFLSDMNFILDEDGKVLFNELLDPSPLDPNIVKDYKRVPKKRSSTILSRQLGWTKYKVTKYLDQIKKYTHNCAVLHGIKEV